MSLNLHSPDDAPISATAAAISDIAISKLSGIAGGGDGEPGGVNRNWVSSGLILTAA